MNERWLSLVTGEPNKKSVRAFYKKTADPLFTFQPTEGDFGDEMNIEKGNGHR